MSTLMVKRSCERIQTTTIGRQVGNEVVSSAVCINTRLCTSYAPHTVMELCKVPFHSECNGELDTWMKTEELAGILNTIAT